MKKISKIQSNKTSFGNEKFIENPHLRANKIITPRSCSSISDLISADKNRSETTQNLITTFEPFKWLSGEWKGIGHGNSSDRKPFSFKNQVNFELLSGIKEGSIVHLEEKVLPALQRRVFKHLEYGFFKIEEDRKMQFCACYNTGQIENFYGEFEFIDKEKKSFQALFTGEHTPLDYTKSFRQNEITMTLADGILTYILMLSTDMSDETYHINSNLSKC